MTMEGTGYKLARGPPLYNGEGAAVCEKVRQRGRDGQSARESVGASLSGTVPICGHLIRREAGEGIWWRSRSSQAFCCHSILPSTSFPHRYPSTPSEYSSKLASIVLPAVQIIVP